MEWRGCRLITPLPLLCISVLHNCQICIILVPIQQHNYTVRGRPQREVELNAFQAATLPMASYSTASLRLFPQMKFLSHHQGEARAAWTRYATSGKRKEICKLNSLFIGIIGSHQLLIATPDTIKLHGLAESKITVLGFILADGIKWLNGTLETILS